jgi:transcription initiation factor TFIIB
MKVMSAAAVYMGCRQCGVALTIKDIAHVSRISPKQISHVVRSILRQLDLPMQPNRVSDHASTISARLALPTRTTEIVEKIARALDCSRLCVGKNPAGIACAVIYLSSLLAGERKTQREVAEVVRITEATIRTRSGNSKRTSFSFCTYDFCASFSCCSDQKSSKV